MATGPAKDSSSVGDQIRRAGETAEILRTGLVEIAEALECGFEKIAQAVYDSATDITSSIDNKSLHNVQPAALDTSTTLEQLRAIPKEHRPSIRRPAPEPDTPSPSPLDGSPPHPPAKKPKRRGLKKGGVKRGGG